MPQPRGVRKPTRPPARVSSRRDSLAALPRKQDTKQQASERRKRIPRRANESSIKFLVTNRPFNVLDNYGNYIFIKLRISVRSINARMSGPPLRPPHSNATETALPLSVSRLSPLAFTTRCRLAPEKSNFNCNQSGPIRTGREMDRRRC